MMANFNSLVIPNNAYSPITSKGGRRRSRRARTRKNKRRNKSRTRRNY